MAMGGFGAVLGNPPWERIKLQEQEFFVARDPEIAQAPNAADQPLKPGPVGEYLEVAPPPSPRKYWSRRGIAEWLVERLSEDAPTLVGIDHGFSFPLRYFETHGLKPDWSAFLDDFQSHWPTDDDHAYVDFVREFNLTLGLRKSYTGICVRTVRIVRRLSLQGASSAGRADGRWLFFVASVQIIGDRPRVGSIATDADRISPSSCAFGSPLRLAVSPNRRNLRRNILPDLRVCG